MSGGGVLELCKVRVLEMVVMIGVTIIPFFKS